MRAHRLVSLLFLTCLYAMAAPPVFYVANNGNDQWSGKLTDPNSDNTDGPFATLSHARDAMRSVSKDGHENGAAVYVRGGVYYLREPLTFDAQDSGVEGHPVLWHAYKDETVELVGGVLVKDFKPYKDKILQRDCSDLGLPNVIHELFLDGEGQILARWPNKGEGELPGGGWAFVGAQLPEKKNGAFKYLGDDISKFAGINGLEISIWPNYNWWQTISTVKSIDPATKTMQLGEDISYTIEPGRRYFLQNALELLDAPGEWFYDGAKKTLFFWPPKDLDDKSQVIAPAGDTVIQATGLCNVNFIGLNIAASYNDGVSLKDCNDVLFAKAAVRNTYGFGIVVQGGKSVRIHGNDIYATGKGGITLSGGDRKTLAPGNHEAVNNHIHDYAQIFNTYNCAINIDGVGNRIQHNLIHDAPHIGILLTGNDHLIEYNEIHHVCMQGADNGGFYMGRDWTQRGNVIRYNKFHDIYGFGTNGPDKEGNVKYQTPNDAWGIYLDDCTSGTKIIGNLFYRVPLCGVMIGGGRDNVVENNLFSECTPALHIDDRWDAYPYDLMRERLKAMDPEKPPYSERYPELLKMGDDPRTPANNHFERNIITYSKDEFRGLSTTEPHPGKGIIYDVPGFDEATTKIDNNLISLGGLPIRVAYRAYKHPEGAGDLDWDAWRKKGFDQNGVELPVEFVDPAHDDYTLRASTKGVKRIKFEALPLDQMGLYQDELRASWPVPADTRRDGAEHKEWKIKITP